MAASSSTLASTSKTKVDYALLEDFSTDREKTDTLQQKLITGVRIGLAYLNTEENSENFGKRTLFGESIPYTGPIFVVEIPPSTSLKPNTRAITPTRSQIIEMKIDPASSDPTILQWEDIINVRISVTGAIHFITKNNQEVSYYNHLFRWECIQKIKETVQTQLDSYLGEEEKFPTVLLTLILNYYLGEGSLSAPFTPPLTKGSVPPRLFSHYSTAEAPVPTTQTQSKSKTCTIL